MINDSQTRAIRRTKILQGQMSALQKMIEQEQHCMDILTQSLAIQKAMSSLSKLILENHLRTYLVGMLDTDKKADQEKVITELLGLYELYNIRGNRDD